MGNALWRYTKLIFFLCMISSVLGVEMIPKKLKRGSHIRVIAPSTSMSIISKEVAALARKRLESFGYKISFGEHIKEADELLSTSIESRISDLTAAFEDKKVDAILTVIGGYNSNQLLNYIDFDVIKRNPKIFCGYSDITALENAILKKTGLVTYNGPHFSTFGMLKGIDYTIDYFNRCVARNGPFSVEPVKEWSDDEWYLDQEKRKFIKGFGFSIIQKGEANGKIIGGNLSTFMLLNGTTFLPNLSNTVLVLEDDSDTNPRIFDRMLQSVLHQKGSDGIRALVIGRFQNGSNMDNKTLKKIISTKRELKDIPIIADVDCSHVTPRITFPIGGTCRVVSGDNPKLEIIKH